METIHVTLPDELKQYVQDRVGRGGYSSVSEYIRELIRLDRRQSAQALLEAELLKGMASGPPQKMTAGDWAAIKRKATRGTTDEC